MGRKLLRSVYAQPLFHVDGQIEFISAKYSSLLMALLKFS